MHYQSIEICLLFGIACIKIPPSAKSRLFHVITPREPKAKLAANYICAVSQF